MENIIVNSLDEMREIGLNIGKNLKGSEIILLRGNLGAGKTHLTKFIGEGMGIKDYITSPSFALLNIYEGDIALYHFDAYRLEEDIDTELLGFDDYIYSEGVSIIEWPDRMMDIIPNEYLEIRIDYGKNDQERVLYLEGYGQKYEDIIRKMDIWRF